MSDKLISVSDAVRECEEREIALTRYAILRAIRTNQIKNVTRIGQRVYAFPRSDFLHWLVNRRAPGRPRKAE